MWESSGESALERMKAFLLSGVLVLRVGWGLGLRDCFKGFVWRRLEGKEGEIRDGWGLVLLEMLELELVFD